MQFLREHLTKYMYQTTSEEPLSDLQPLKLWTEHELLTSISSSFSASVPASLVSYCRNEHTRHCLHLALGSQSKGVKRLCSQEKVQQPLVTWLKVGEKSL